MKFKRIAHLDQVENQLQRAHEPDAGADIRSTAEVIIRPKESAIIPTGIAVEIPYGYEGKVRPRSGLGFKDDVESFIGTVDSGYHGHLQVKLFNHGYKPVQINKGDRIAQLVVSMVDLSKWEETTEFNLDKENADTIARGTSGFGSTGLQ
jgi:dUTP pyrophosphatase